MEMLGEWNDILVVVNEEIKDDSNQLFEGPEQQYLRQALAYSPAIGMLVHQSIHHPDCRSNTVVMTNIAGDKSPEMSSTFATLTSRFLCQQSDASDIC